MEPVKNIEGSFWSGWTIFPHQTNPLKFGLNILKLHENFYKFENYLEGSRKMQFRMKFLVFEHVRKIANWAIFRLKENSRTIIKKLSKCTKNFLDG